MSLKSLINFKINRPCVRGSGLWARLLYALNENELNLRKSFPLPQLWEILNPWL